PGPSAPPLLLTVTTAATATATTATAASAAPADCTAMASLRVLAFDHEGRPIQFDTWLDDLQLYLLSDIKDGVSLFDHVTAQALYDDVVARYSSPATAALGRLLLPYLFPDLSSFATVEDLVSHLHTSDARYRATVPAEFLDKNQPPMFITLYFIVTRLPDSLRSVRDHFLSLDPTSLTVDLLEQHLLAAETSAVATSLLLRTSGLLLLVRSAAATRARVARVVEVAARVEAGAVVEVVAEVELVEGVGALVAAVEAANERWRWRQWQRRDWWRWDWCSAWWFWKWPASAAAASERYPVAPAASIAIFDLDFDAILSAMYALSVSAEGDCYRCVPPDSGIAAAALGASASGTLPGTALAEALHTFTLDSGATRCFFRDSTTLTPLPAPVLVRLADPSGVPVVVRSSTVLPCPAVPSGSLSGPHLPSFSTKLVSTAALQGSMVTTTTPGGQRVSICTCTWTGRHLAAFTRWPGSSLYTLATESPQVASSTQVCASPPCLPYVEGRQRAAPHSSSFPPATAPVQTLHMDVWAPARVSGQGRERYFLLSVSSSASGSVRTFLSCVCTLTEVVSSPPNSYGTFVVGRAFSSPQPLAPCLLAGDLAHTASDGGGWRCVGVPALPPPPSSPSPPSMGMAGRGGGKLGGSGGGRRGSAALGPPPFSYLPLLWEQQRGGGDLQHLPRPPFSSISLLRVQQWGGGYGGGGCGQPAVARAAPAPPLLLPPPCCGCSSGGGGDLWHQPPPPPPSPPSPAAGALLHPLLQVQQWGEGMGVAGVGATAGWRVWGWRVCEPSPAPPPPPSPTAAAAAEGGGCVGA
ncbi:unnamed protein product, partial [Closterium sp. NIES-54]